MIGKRHARKLRRGIVLSRTGHSLDETVERYRQEEEAEDYARMLGLACRWRMLQERTAEAEGGLVLRAFRHTEERALRQGRTPLP